ncbi:MAG: 3-beta-hydroxy-Delta(5)-steroid dehydrogenase [Alphaproteobacteria bacterium]|nr:MAG: 3-beta-hydroxy-Delta(5)-steroid dehydrogenase [Alphaproteobacteria bacterium]
MAARLITVFGGSGFIGRYLVQRLARRGWQIRVAVRHPAQALFLKPLGDVGQITPVPASLRHEGSIRAAVAGSDAVVNLVGILYQRGRQGFAEIHAEGARRVAEAARAAGAERLVQMSALGADPSSPSDYARSKAAGEAAAAAAFPGASIVRPSVVFGPEDGFFNRFAALARYSPVLPLIGGGHTRFQPVYVGDVADALLRIVEDPACAGRTYELGGPQVYSFRELMELTLETTCRDRWLIPVPFWLASLQAAFLGLLPSPPLTRDQVRLLQRDNVVSPGAPGLAELGIAPTATEVVIPTYLDIYRRRSRLARA